MPDGADNAAAAVMAKGGTTRISEPVSGDGYTLAQGCAVGTATTRAGASKMQRPVQALGAAMYAGQGPPS